MLKALATIALLVGSSSAALAHPVRFDGNHDRDDRRFERQRHDRYDRYDRDDRYEHRRYWQPQRRFFYQRPYVRPFATPPVYQYQPYQQSWMPLMGAQPIGYEGRAFVRVDSQPGALHALRLEATNGDTFVSSIDIEYTDGRHQVVTVGQELEAENPSYEVALDSTCGIEDIAINGRSEDGGAIALSAL
ncbi:MAG: hypothetical protein ACM31C_16555 [Acidobacteriota bacterium]